MTTTETSREPADGDAILADLADWWTHPRPAKFTGAIPRRIAGSEWDQQVPEGTENPYWQIVRQLPLEEMRMPWETRPEPMTHVITDGPRGSDMRYFCDRHDLCATYSWSICSPGDIAWMKGILGGKGVVEVGAGSGYWAWQMRQAGIDVVAYDANIPGEHYFARRQWSGVLHDDASAASRHPDRTLFLCWPSYSDPWAAQALACYQGDVLIYAGEGEGGCTADNEFFEMLGAEWEEADSSSAHISYWGIHCYLSAYRRKPQGRLADESDIA